MAGERCLSEGVSNAFVQVYGELGQTSASAAVCRRRASAMSPRDYPQATSLAGPFPDHSITLFDATLAILASRLTLPVWTHEHHFDTVVSSIWR